MKNKYEEYTMVLKVVSKNPSRTTLMITVIKCASWQNEGRSALNKSQSTKNTSLTLITLN